MTPAILGGIPRFANPIQIVRPSIIDRADELAGAIRSVLVSGEVTNGPNVRALEGRMAEFLGVREVVAVSSCTLGLALAIRAAGLAGSAVLLPAFTIAATATAALWNGCKVTYVDVDPETFTLDLDDLERKIASGAGLVLGVHLFGNPCAVVEISSIVARAGASVAFDAAQALGASLNGQRLGGFGRFEVFSASPSKHFTTVEGGFVATDDRELAEKVRLGRNYGVTPEYHCAFPGLNARLSELHAVVGLALLHDVDAFIKNRNEYTRLYRDRLGCLPGLGFQRIRAEAVSAYNYFGLTVDPEQFGLTNRELARALEAEGIQTKIYYQSPLHREPALGGASGARLPGTDYLVGRILCLPLYNQMEPVLIEEIVSAVQNIHEHATAIHRALPARRE